MGFKNHIRAYFTFNRRERNGVFVLLTIILLLLLYLSFSHLFVPKTTTDFSQFEKEISEFEAAQKQMNDSMSEQKTYLSGNHLIENREGGYRDHFKSTTLSYNSRFTQHGRSVRVEINSSDTSELMKVKGIGPVFAKRIVKFRNALGGFVRLDQLLEVYGFDKEKFDQVASQISLDTNLIKRLNINSASVDDLNMHPYISKKEAVAIYTHRVNHGDYANLQIAKTIALMTDSAFSKVVPYLSIQ